MDTRNHKRTHKVQTRNKSTKEDQSRHKKTKEETTGPNMIQGL